MKHTEARVATPKLRTDVGHGFRQFVHVVIVLALTHASATAVVAQAPDESLSPWSLSALGGLTDLSIDVDAPGSMSMLAIERDVVSRIALRAELGLGLIGSYGVCRLGSAVEIPCEQSTWWRTVGVGARAQLFRSEERGANSYLLGLLGRQGPDLDGWYDVGFGLSFRTLANFDLGVEWRRRWGSEGGEGSLYLIRVHKRFGER